MFSLTMEVDPHPTAETEEPLPPARPALWLGGGGTILVLLALLLGMGAASGLDGPRVVLTMAGLILAGVAVSVRPGDHAVVGLGGAAALLAVGGFPASWDSFRLVAGVFAGLALLGIALQALPNRGRLAVVSLLIVCHFIGVLTAITTVRDQPWLSAQLWARVYRPYLQFTWLNNSYQFFAPDPGTPTELWFCIEYDSAGPDRFAWVVVPRRSDSHDPLLNSFNRRIILPEQAAYGFSPTNLLESELREINQLREAPLKNPVTGEEQVVPHHPKQPADRQLMIPANSVQRFILPSYIQHVAAANQRPGATIKSIRAYRVQHIFVSAEQFVAAIDDEGKTPRRVTPYDPTTYLPYYLGVFDASGTILPGPDPMRWWMIPITAKPDLMIPPVYFRSIGETDYDRAFNDFVKFHAGTDGYRKGP